jgi:hypothetical protein
MRSRLRRALLSACLLLAAAASAEEGAADRYRVVVPRLKTAPVIDGKLDEAAWTEALVLDGFTQMEPNDGQPSTERTVVRIGYDAKALYVGFRCYTADAKKLAPLGSMNRDANLDNEDHVEIAIDTFRDRQNAFLFLTNPTGARVDGTIRDDGEDVRWDWDSNWSVGTSRDEEGWTAEFAIPFEALRFPDAEQLSFGINFARYIAHNHELAFWKPLQYARGLTSSRYKVSGYGEARGFAEIDRGKLFEVRPYALLGATRPGSQSPDRLAQGGLDVKVPITSSLVADVTINPDFADAEADEQQLNLTRFPLLLPEKREFFKEGASLFYFGDRIADASTETFEQFSFFQSRSIGLAMNGQATIPVLGGARVSGQVGPVGVGLLNLTTPEVHDAATGIDTTSFNYSVMRLKYQLPGGSSFGGMGLNKAGGDGSFNRGFGGDWNFVLTDNLRVGGYVARTLTSGLRGDDIAGSGDVFWQSEHLSFRGVYSDIGSNFDPEMGYLTRAGIRKVELNPILVFSAPQIGVRHIYFIYDWNFVMDRNPPPTRAPGYSFNLDTRLQKLEIVTVFTSGWALGLVGREEFEHIDAPFTIYSRPGSTPGTHNDVVIAPGSYEFRTAFIGISSDLTKPVGAILWLEGGPFWGGSRQRTRLALNVKPLQGVNLQAVYDGSHVDLPVQLDDSGLVHSGGEFTSHILSVVATYAVTTRLQTRATLQYSSDNTSRANLVVDWNYIPGASAYLILNQQRDLLGGRPWLDTQMVAVKLGYAWGMSR